MLSINEISLSRGNLQLLEKASLTIFDKQRIGLIGPNGSGKTSLFSAIQGTLEINEGNIEQPNHLRIVHLKQEIDDLEADAIDYALSGDKTLIHIRKTLAMAEANKDHEKIIKCHARLADIDGYSADSRAAKVLTGLGFSQADMKKTVKEFSGGWRVRLNIAQCLLTPSDFLLLDEPTNHLDMEAIIWLEKFLNHYKGSLIIISHDRDFLDGIVTHIAHIENKKIKLYTGNYSTFEKQRALEMELQAAQYKKQQAKIAHMMKFVERFRYKATKAKQAQSRLKAIAKMQAVAVLHEKSPFQFSFKEPKRQPNPLIVLDKVTLGYNDDPLLMDIKLSIHPGDRIGLLGLNGAGKSTLIKCLANELPPLFGDITLNTHTCIGYFAQHQLEYLEGDKSAMQHLQMIADNVMQAQLQSYLGSFGFNRDASLRPIRHFSGGEKARLALALIIWKRPNLLLLDEPTNHLDMEVRESLMIALQNYSGAMILVTHDRYLLRHLVNEFYLVANGNVKRYAGDLKDYQKSIN